jgi:uncharacterized protein
LAASMRIIIVSDTHGALDERIAHEARRSDVVVHAGDIGSRQVLEALTPPSGEVHAVRGNNDVRDKWPRSDWEFLESLPWEVRLDLPGGQLVVVHGHGYGYPGRCHERMRGDYPHARAVVYGHSHRRCADQSASPWVLNPGVAGKVRTFGGPAYCRLRASASRWRLEPIQFTENASTASAID